jgi:hypothetical protein
MEAVHTSETSVYSNEIHNCHMALQPNSGPGLPYLGFLNNNLFYETGLLVQRPASNLEDQFSVFMNPEDRVAQLYPPPPRSVYPF